MIFYHPRLNHSNSENVCSLKTYTIIPHLPNEIPTEFHHTRFNLHYTEKLGIEMQAKSVRTDDSLRRISPDRRNCFFEGERSLKFFKSYSRAHCNLECIANLTLEKCNCVQFFMPRDKNTTVCTYTQLECILNATRDFGSIYTEEELLACACYSPCNDIKYSYEVYRTGIDALTTSSYAGR